MPQRSILTSQSPSISHLHLKKTSRLGLTLGTLLAAMVVLPTAHAASCKPPKSYYKNVSCTASSSYFLAVKDFGAPVALIDNSGKKSVDLTRYQRVDANKIANGLLPVQRNSRVGYVNMQGREVIPTIYDMLNEAGGKSWARPVSDGRIIVKKGGNYGIISTSNETILPFSAAISDIDNYRSGTARVRKNKATSWVDKNGKVIDNPNGSDRLSASDSKPSSNRQSSTQQSSNNAAATTLSPPAQAGLPASDRFTTLLPYQQDGRWGFVDDNDVTMITYSFNEVRSFSEGLAGVRVNNSWGFVNLGGELVIPFRFDNSPLITNGNYNGVPSFVFKDNKAWIGSLENGSKMCIDTAGTSVGCD
ncbi:hypothetical protein RCH20_001628 [Psychrobacter sp. PL15]|uniref:WG repeat-containing protein n=1 Tax=Psychrobacter sp. PL15 TaxID=3071719 RepID=UPI002E0898FC|nr:hypothetical protein [Psychrobacter sp. PL15]